MKKLKDLKIGESAEVSGYENCAPAYRMKLLSMGLTKGVVFTLAKMAPLGDPVELRLRGKLFSFFR